MTITLGIVMDPIHNINPKKDSSFGLLLAAQARGWVLAYMEPSSLFIENFEPNALTRPLTVRDNVPNWFELGQPKYMPLKELSVILMRQDPPVDRAYLHTTQILDYASRQGVLVINKPQGLRDYNEKLLALDFPQYCPPTLVTQSIKKACQFLLKYGDIIAKPLDGMGGQSIFRVKKSDGNQRVIFETLLQREERYFLLQQYIPDIQKGDKRIIMIDGEPVPYGLARIPAEGETRANLAAGGTGIATPLTEYEHTMCQAIGPTLKEKGLVWVGLDVIGEYLTEINITSPTCVRELEMQCNLNIYQQLLDCILQKIM
jgi:glutathione synthase